jgi:hypothetical protein
MRKITLITAFWAISMTALLSSCKKEPVSPSNSISGIYQAPQGSQVSQVVVTNTGNNTLKVEIKQIEFSYQYTSVVLSNVVADPATGIAKISEDAGIIEQTGTFHFEGTLNINGSHAVLSTTASKSSGAGAESNEKTYSFVGDKVN